jgi:hypothetical protein
VPACCTATHEGGSGLVVDDAVVEVVRRAFVDVNAKDESAVPEVIRSMVDPAGGRRSVDLTGLGSAFGQD